MAVSSKSIIHYTGNINNIKGIINDSSLRLKYCNENIVFDSDDQMSVAFPMVCFCDLPLSLAKDHITKYGSYGIGFSKEWARKNQLNPVLYLEQGSTLSIYLSKQTDKILDAIHSKESFSKEDMDELYKFAHVLGFCKNHIGLLSRKGKKEIQDYVFYDEREWRYIPSQETLEESEMVVSGPAYAKNKDKFNSKLKGKSLLFDHNDISYIIVKTDKDIPEIVDCIRSKYYNKLPAPTLHKLYTKIISVNQIRDDF